MPVLNYDIRNQVDFQDNNKQKGHQFLVLMFQNNNIVYLK